MGNSAQLIAQCEALAKQWLTPAFDEETRKEVQAMLDNEDKSALIDASIRILSLAQAVCAASWVQAQTA